MMARASLRELPPLLQREISNIERNCHGLSLTSYGLGLIFEARPVFAALTLKVPCSAGALQKVSSGFLLHRRTYFYREEAVERLSNEIRVDDSGFLFKIEGAITDLCGQFPNQSGRNSTLKF